MAFVDVFAFLMVVFVMALPFAFMLRNPKKGAAVAVH
jgi:hypothetical protein